MLIPCPWKLPILVDTRLDREHSLARQRTTQFLMWWTCRKFENKAVRNVPFSGYSKIWHSKISQNTVCFSGLGKGTDPLYDVICNSYILHYVKRYMIRLCQWAGFVKEQCKVDSSYKIVLQFLICAAQFQNCVQLQIVWNIYVPLNLQIYAISKLRCAN